MDDPGGGTSSASTKLIHGGLRYLEHYDFALVRESLAEREILLARRAAHHRARCASCCRTSRPAPAWLLRLGLFLYDHIGAARAVAGQHGGGPQRHDPAGAPLKPHYRRGFVYSDGWVDDARLVVLCALDAQQHGATVLTRCACVDARRGDTHWQATLRHDDGREQRLLARALVNAAGPWAAQFLDQHAHQRDVRALRLVKGSHIVVKRLFDHPYAYFFQLPDGRIFFAIPYEREFTLIGTTDADQRPGDPIKASEAEIAYLCEGASRYFARAVTPADVVWTFSGVRPLIDDGSGRPEAATRGYRLDLSEAEEGAPLLSVYGGKITTYRHLAEEAVDRLAQRLPVLTGKSWTASAPLPGGDFAVDGLPALIAQLAADYPALTPADADRIARAYGTRALRWLDAPRGRDFGAGLCQAELDYLMAEEWAVSAEDVLWRRTKLGLRLDAAQVAGLEAYMAGKRG
jgi:glycerol-3-phosphate dehydrogenase